MGKTTEADTFVRMGLKNNPKSHVCWHVYGLIFRARKNYDQAVRSYKMALRLDPTSMQITRDLSLLQVQNRNLNGYLESRAQLLQLKSTKRDNWIGLAIANHLNDNRQRALDVLKAYRGTLSETTIEDKCTYENSEIVMYENMILREIDASTPETILKHLDENKDFVKSRAEFVIAKSRALLRLGDFERATRGYSFMLGVNPENYSFHRGYQYCLLKTTPSSRLVGLGALDVDYVGTELPVHTLSLTSAQREMIRSHYAEMRATRFPKARAPKAIEMLYCDATMATSFETLVRSDLERALERAMTSYMCEIKNMFRQESDRSIRDMKMKVVETILDEYVADGNDADRPQVFLHALLLRAQTYDLVHGDTASALKMIERAIEHTPTYVDAYMCKARVLKHMGKLKDAAEACDVGRTLDLQDRYINCKCTKYLLRCDEPERAYETASLFLKNEDGEVKRTLSDMQACWYETECGEAHLRRKEYGKALKQLTYVHKHFDDMEYDQFDFHTYCMRKMTLRAYVRMLRMADRLRAHRFFLRASRAAVTCYLELLDASVAKKNASVTSENTSSSSSSTDGGTTEGTTEGTTATKTLTAKERKRLKQQEAKKRKAAAKATASTTKTTSSKTKKGKETDDDPNGEKLAATTDPLGDAEKIVRVMNKHAPHHYVTASTCFDVAMRRKQYLVALRSLRRAKAAMSRADDVPARLQMSRKIERLHTSRRTEWRRRVALFSDAIKSVTTWSHDAVRDVLLSESKRILGDDDDTDGFVLVEKMSAMGV